MEEKDITKMFEEFVAKWKTHQELLSKMVVKLVESQDEFRNEIRATLKKLSESSWF